MSALKIKNSDGTWQEIPMLKGKKGDAGRDAAPVFRVDVEPIVFIHVGPDGKLESDWSCELSYTGYIDDVYAGGVGSTGEQPSNLSVVTESTPARTISMSASQGMNPIGDGQTDPEGNCFKYIFPVIVTSASDAEVSKTVYAAINIVTVPRGNAYILTAQDKADIYNMLLEDYPAVEEVSF